jgi:hypothetical protein
MDTWARRRWTAYRHNEPSKGDKSAGQEKYTNLSEALFYLFKISM